MDFRYFLIGSCTGVVTKTSTAPLDRLKILYQVQTMKHPEKYGSVLNSLKTIVKEEGVNGLYKGNVINCIRIVPKHSFKFMFSDFYKNLLLSKNPTTVGFIGAGIATGVSQTMCTYPLEVLRTRYALPETKGFIISYTRELLKKEGIAGLYRGVYGSLLIGSICIGLQLGTYDILKSKTFLSETVYSNAFYGALAGVVSQTLTYPGDVVKARLHSDGILGKRTVYTGAIDCYKKIFVKEGLKGFYKGVGVNIIRTIPATAIQFSLYDKLKSLL